MGSEERKRADQLRSEHRQESRDHALWRRDVERWRSSYRETLIACGRRVAAHLELDNFEDALDRHEAAIDAHEEAIVRHEKTLALEHGSEIGLSEDSLDFHRVMGSRHARSRESHEQLERSHRAILAALEMLGRK